MTRGLRGLYHMVWRLATTRMGRRPQQPRRRRPRRRGRIRSAEAGFGGRWRSGRCGRRWGRRGVAGVVLRHVRPELARRSTGAVGVGGKVGAPWGRAGGRGIGRIVGTARGSGRRVSAVSVGIVKVSRASVVVASSPVVSVPRPRLPLLAVHLVLELFDADGGRASRNHVPQPAAAPLPLAIRRRGGRGPLTSSAASTPPVLGLRSVIPPSGRRGV